MKEISTLLMILLLAACGSDNSTKITAPQDSIYRSPINLLDCETEEFSQLFIEIGRFLPSLHPQCSEFKVAFKEITAEEREVMKKCMDEHVSRYVNDNPESDSAIFFQEYVFTDLQFCGPSISYESTDSCSFYTGTIYHSKDLKIQFIRLFQTGRSECFDVYLNLSGPKPEVMAFG